MTERTLPDAWTGPLEEMGSDGKPVEAPDDASGDWFELYSHFATRGFLRALLGLREEADAVRVQLALPTEDYAGRRVLEAVSAEFEETLGGSWRVGQVDPDWQLVAELDATPDRAAVAAFFGRLDDLAAVTDADALDEASWLTERLERSSTAESQGGDAERAEQTATAEDTGSAGGDVFESIGDSESGAAEPTPMLEDAGLASYEIAESGDGLDIRIGLDIELPVTDLEQLGTALAHALRARYDLDVRPLPAEDDHPSLGASSVALRAEPTDLGVAEVSDPAEMRSRVDEYFARLERFDGLGVKLADVLGISEGSERTFERTEPTSARETERPERPSDRGTDRAGDGGGGGNGSQPTEAPSQPASDRRNQRSHREQRETDEESGVVLDIGGESASEPPSPSGELEAGNYRDPRLMREDATTALVDVVLRHPGYAEEKMAHNLSILLSIDYPDAMDLVESAPCVIAWGVGHDRGENFKRVIEKAGGRVVLVEPDSLSE